MIRSIGCTSARDLLTDALAAAGPTADGVRRALRLAIADDLRLASGAARERGLTQQAPKRVRHAGDWPLLEPRRAAPGTPLRALQDGMPPCDGGARPVLSGDGSERAMLIGQAPGWREIATGVPFAHDAGKRLAGWLALAGVTRRRLPRSLVRDVGRQVLPRTPRRRLGRLAAVPCRDCDAGPRS